MIGLLMDKQVIKYAKHLSGQSNNANFCSSSCLDSQEELFEFRVSSRPNNSMRYFNDHASDMRRTMLRNMTVYQLPRRLVNRWHQSTLSRELIGRAEVSEISDLC